MAVVVPTVEELIEQLAPDLQGLLDARKVGRQTQADLAKIGVDSIAMLSAIAINREGLEKVAKDMLSIDVAGGGGDEQIKFAQLYLAWQAATKRVKVQDEMDAEASAQKESKPVPPQELMALRQKFEAEFYKLKDAEVPSKASMLFEQIDLGEFRPMALRHFGSRADNEEAEVGNLHVAKSGQVKIRKSRVETSAPVTLEDFRAKVILMANHYLFARFRYPNKQLLQKINPFTFLDYLGYLTGKHVAQMETQTVDGVTLHRPSVKLTTSTRWGKKSSRRWTKEVAWQRSWRRLPKIRTSESVTSLLRWQSVQLARLCRRATKKEGVGISGLTLMTRRREKERVRKERGKERKGGSINTSCTPPLLMEGSSALRGIIVRKDAKETVEGSMRVASACTPVTPRSSIHQRRRRLLLQPLDYHQRWRQFHGPGFYGSYICLQAPTGRQVWGQCWKGSPSFIQKVSQ